MRNIDPIVSIIMPVYNSENDVHMAIDSIVNQTFKAWELLVVDDCSTDNTRAIVTEYTKKDTRIHLLLQEKNSGPGQAKNLGMKEAKGKYITFCDGDDWLEEDAYEKILAVGTSDADIIMTGFYRDVCDTDGKLLERSLVCSEQFECKEKMELILRIPDIDEKRLFSYAVNKLYRAEIIKKYNVQFSNKKFGEDFDFNIEFFAHAESAVMLDEGFYHYIKKNSESLTERFIPNFFEINKDRFARMKKIMVDNSVYSGAIQQKIMSAYIKHVLAAISRLYDERGGYSVYTRREEVKKMLTDEMSREALRFSKSNSIKEKVCNAVFKTNNITINLIFGKILWFMQTKGKKLYERVK